MKLRKIFKNFFQHFIHPQHNYEESTCQEFCEFQLLHYNNTAFINIYKSKTFAILLSKNVCVMLLSRL